MHDQEKDPFSDKAAQWDTRPLVRNLVVAAAGVGFLDSLYRQIYSQTSSNVDFLLTKLSSMFFLVPSTCRL